MGQKWGIIYDYGTAIDLDPFPHVPVGALYVDEYFLVHHAMTMLSSTNVDHLMVVTEVGAAYVKYAVADYERNGKISVVYLPEMDSKGGGRLVKAGLVSAISDFSQPVALVGSNIVTDMRLEELEHSHKAHRRPYATVVCVPGLNSTPLECPTGYRPVELMMLEKGIIKCGATNKSQSLWDLLADADERGNLEYYLYDGLMFEISSEEDYLLMKGK